MFEPIKNLAKCFLVFGIMFQAGLIARHSVSHSNFEKQKITIIQPERIVENTPCLVCAISASFSFSITTSIQVLANLELVQDHSYEERPASFQNLFSSLQARAPPILRNSPV